MAHPAQAVDLPEASNHYIAQMLAHIFHYRHQISLTDEPDDWARLERYAHKVCEQLRYESQSVVDIPTGTNPCPLQTILHRQELLAWAEIMLPKPVYETIPRYCPACKELLAGHWDCAFCGLELENTERHNWHYQSSVLPSTYLPLGVTTIADPMRQRIMLMKTAPSVVILWEIGAPFLKAQEPVDALFLPGPHLLVTDRAGNRVFECGLFGNETWSFQPETMDLPPLNRPVKATLYRHQGKEHILIVDQGNHRVLAVDRDKQVMWQYGHTGQARDQEGYLNEPADAQLTHDDLILIADTGNNRLLGINPITNQVVWHSPDFISLDRPTAIQERYNRQVMVVDSGHFRVIELSRDNEIEEECVYYSPEMPALFKLATPTRCLRLANQHVILQDETCWLEIQFLQQRLIQKGLLSEMRCEYQAAIALSLDATPEIMAETERNLRQSRGEFVLDDVLRQVKVFADAPEAFFRHIAQYLVAEEIQAGQILVKQGDIGDAMYVIERGEVEVFKEPAHIIAVLEQGDIFGEMALLLQEPRNASVKVRQSGRILRLSKIAFESAIQPFPEVLEALKELVATRQSVASLKKNAHIIEGNDSLEAILARQRHKVDEIKQRFQGHQRRSPLLVTAHPSWRLLYRKSEQHIIHHALRQRWQCYELHIFLQPDFVFKTARLVLIVRVLERLGTLIKTFPDAPDVEKGEIGHTFAVTLLTQVSKEQLLEDVASIAEVDKVDIFTIYF